MTFLRFLSLTVNAILRPFHLSTLRAAFLRVPLRAAPPRSLAEIMYGDFFDRNEKQCRSRLGRTPAGQEPRWDEWPEGTCDTQFGGAQAEIQRECEMFGRGELFFQGVELGGLPIVIHKVYHARKFLARMFHILYVGLPGDGLGLV